jgi:hypothetical protein
MLDDLTVIVVVICPHRTGRSKKEQYNKMRAAKQ